MPIKFRGASDLARGVIYREGGEPAPGVYTTIAGALSAAGAGGVVLVDGSLGQPKTEALAYDWSNVELRLGLWTGGAFSLDIVAGTTFTNLERVSGGLWLNNKSSAAVMTVSSPASAEIWFSEGASVFTDAAGTAPFFKANNGATLYIYMGPNCYLDGQGVHAVVEATAGASIAIGLQPGAAIGADTLTGAGAIAVTRGLGSVIWGTLNATQTGALALTKDPA